AEQTLRLEVVFIAVKTEQVVENQRGLRPLHQLSIPTARWKILVAIGGIGQDLVQKNIDARFLRCLRSAIRAGRADLRARYDGGGGGGEHVLQGSSDRRDRKVVAHRRPPFRSRKYSSRERCGDCFFSAIFRAGGGVVVARTSTRPIVTWIVG